MYYAVLLVDCFDSLRSTRCEELRSSRIPPDPNETSAMARHAPTQYSSDSYSNFIIFNVSYTLMKLIIYLFMLIKGVSS